MKTSPAKFSTPIFYSMKRLILLTSLCLSIYSLSFSSFAEEDLPYVEIKYADDFSQLGKIARDEHKIILLEVSASDCEYCELLEEEFLKPMLRSGDYQNVLIRKIDMDGDQAIKDFSGNTKDPADLSYQLKVKLTPTLLFFDGFGNELAPRILGINSLDLYGGYLDNAINTSLQKIKP